MKKNAILSMLILLIPMLLLGQEPRFYLSTDKIFTPGEEAFITIESREVSFADIRVYRIDDPLAFFTSQADAHQPIEINQYSGTNALKILRSVFNKDLQQWRRFPRRFINTKFRADLLGEYQDLKEVGIPSEKEAMHAMVKILGNYPLVRHFRHTFSQEGGGWAYEKISINETGPGVFLVEGVNQDHVGYTLVVISNLALITKQSGDSLLCFAVDKISGLPVPGTALEVLNTQSRGKIASGSTGKDGTWLASIKDVSQLTIIARKDNQVSIIDPTFFPVSVDHRKVYIYTDRPVYRPGQEVFYKGIVRDFVDETYKGVMSLPVAVRVLDPKGNEMVSQEINLNELGTFNGSFKMGDEPVIGTYKIIADLQGKSHQGEFKVKEYQKPKFKVEVELEGSGLNGAKVKAAVTAKYYFGSPVQGASLSYFVYRTRFYVPWWIDEDYSWYYSEAEYRSTRQELVTQGEGELDQEGRFYFDFETQADAHDFTYLVEARVKDQSNFTVVGQGSIKTSQGQFNIGIRTSRLIYSASQEVTVSFYTHDLNNRPVPAGFGFKAIRVEPVGKDKTQVKEKVIYNKQVETGPSGRVEVTFKVKDRGHIQLVAQGVDRFDHVIRGSASIWVAGPGEAVSYSGEGIEIVADKLSYRVKDTAAFLVLSRTPDIPFLFTVEGGNLYHHQVQRFKGNACLIQVPLKEQYTPNVYVQAAAIFADRFYLGKKTVIIPPVEKLLKVSLKTDQEVYRPGEEVTVEVQVRDNQGRPVQVELSLGVVDESIYALSPELAVDMEKFFYPRKGNNVRTNNSLTFNFYGYSQDIKRELARLEMRKDSGLSSFKGSAQSLRQVFKDTCFWTPAVMTSLKGEATIKFRLPDNITQWRLTARVVNWYTQVGSAVGSFISRRDLSVLMDPPLTFSEGDQVTLPILLKNITNQKMEGQLDFKVEGGQVIGSFDRSFSLKPMGTAEIPVKLKVTGREVVLTAAAQAGTFSDSVRLTVPVTPYGVEKTQTVTALLAPEEKQKKLSLVLPEEAFKQFYQGELYIHPGVYRAVLSSLNYLAEYPYGCVEQTMSGFLPDVVLAGVLKKQEISNPALKQKVDGFIAEGIGRLLGFQNENGGWGWWREEQEDGFMTAYVMYGLTMARSLGYRIADAPFNKGLAALEKLVAREIPKDVRMLCLYVLSLADRGPTSIILDAHRKRGSLSPYGLGLLVLSLDRVGKTREAQAAADFLVSNAIPDKASGTVHWEGEVQYRLISNDAPIESTAFAIQALLKTRPQVPEVMAGVHWLMNQRQGERWESTRDTAAAVLALSEYIALSGVQEKTGDSVRYRLNKSPWVTVEPGVLYSDLGKSLVSLPRENLQKGSNQLEIEKNTSGELFVSLALSYYSREKETRTGPGSLQIRREYYKVSSSEGGWEAEALEDDENIVFRSGEEFLVKLEVQASGSYEYMVLEDFIPAGFQVIEDARGYNFSDTGINESLEYRQVVNKEVRDNRMVFFFNQLNPGENLVVYYLMRAALEGEYRVNPAVIRSMYYNNQRALSSRLEVKVTSGRRPRP